MTVPRWSRSEPWLRPWAEADAADAGQHRGGKPAAGMGGVAGRGDLAVGGVGEGGQIGGAGLGEGLVGSRGGLVGGGEGLGVALVGVLGGVGRVEEGLVGRPELLGRRLLVGLGPVEGHAPTGQGEEDRVTLVLGGRTLADVELGADEGVAVALVDQRGLGPGQIVGGGGPSAGGIGPLRLAVGQCLLGHDQGGPRVAVGLARLGHRGDLGGIGASATSRRQRRGCDRTGHHDAEESASSATNSRHHT